MKVMAYQMWRCVQYLEMILLLFSFALPIHCFSWTKPIILVSLSQMIVDYNSASASRVTMMLHHYQRDASLNSTGTHANFRLPIWSHASPFRSYERSYATRKRQSRKRRDETENPGRAYGRGIGFFLGEPCETLCNKILFHVFCNQTTHLCECLKDYPVKIDNKICLKATQLGESCEYRESCSYQDKNALCSAEGECQCAQGYFAKLDDRKGLMCAPEGNSPIFVRLSSDLISNVNLTTLLSVIASLLVMGILFCAIYTLSKSRFNSHQSGHCANETVPPVVLTGLDIAPSMLSSRRASSTNICNEFLPPSRRSSNSLVPPPSNFASRRPSLSSIHSQSSFASQTQSPYRNYQGVLVVPEERECGAASASGGGSADMSHRNESSPAEVILPSHTTHHSQERLMPNHYFATMKNKAETCLIHSTRINPSVPHH